MNAIGRATAGIASAFFLVVTIGAQTNHSKRRVPQFVENPVLGIGYNPLVVHYELVSDRFRKLCRGHDYQPQAIYAHVHSGSADYYVTAIVDPRVDDDAPLAITLVKNGTCVDGDHQWAHNGVPPKNGYAEQGVIERIPGKDAPEIQDSPGEFHYELRSAHEEWIVRSLDRDALLRGIKAFGVKSVFGRSFVLIRGCTNSLIRM